MNALVYNGVIGHKRLQPVEHAFRFPATFYGFDLDALGELDRCVKGFGWNQAARLRLNDADYLDGSPRPLADKLREQLDVPEDGSIWLVTCPRWFGYVFNPVSFYVVRDADQQPLRMLAEVNNTFKDRHLYRVELEQTTDRVEGSGAKRFHVSPFNDMNGEYQFVVQLESDALSISVNLYKEGRPFLLAWMEGQGRPLDSASLRRQSLRYPFRPWMTMPRILGQAVLLRFRRHLPVFRRPEPSDPDTLMNRGTPRI